MCGREIASQIAAASFRSFFCDCRYGFTNCGATNRTVCPNVANTRAQWCAPWVASRPIVQIGRFAKKSLTCPRRNRLRRTTRPLSSTPCTWKTFFAVSRPMTLADMESPRRSITVSDAPDRAGSIPSRHSTYSDGYQYALDLDLQVARGGILIGAKRKE